MAHGERHWKHRAAPGERHGSAKLTADQIPAIRLDDRSLRLIAQDYGVSRPMVCMIKSGKRWAHLQEAA